MLSHGMTLAQHSSISIEIRSKWDFARKFRFDAHHKAKQTGTLSLHGKPNMQPRRTRMQIFQQTLQDTAFFQGVGLHSGKIVDVIVSPAPDNSGIKFLRSDIPDSKPIQASIELVSSTDLCTTLQSGLTPEDKPLTIGTIEHLMAALFGFGIDNALVQVNSPELPILDGSAAPYIDAFSRIGTKTQDSVRLYYRVVRPFELQHNGSVMAVEPCTHLQFDCTIDFSHSKVIGRQGFVLDFSRENFFQVADARTFCHIKNVESMRKVGLALGGSLDNAVVVNDEGVINAEGLRHPNEFARHKLLDLVGDLSLLGRPIIGKVRTYRGGHGMHARFMRELLASAPQALETVDFAAAADGPARPPRYSVAGIR